VQVFSLENFSRSVFFTTLSATREKFTHFRRDRETIPGSISRSMVARIIYYSFIYTRIIPRCLKAIDSLPTRLRNRRDNGPRALGWGGDFQERRRASQRDATQVVSYIHSRADACPPRSTPLCDEYPCGSLLRRHFPPFHLSPPRALRFTPFNLLFPPPGRPLSSTEAHNAAESWSVVCLHPLPPPRRLHSCPL